MDEQEHDPPMWFSKSCTVIKEDKKESPPPPPENLREAKGMKGTEKANCGVKEKQ